MKDIHILSKLLDVYNLSIVINKISKNYILRKFFWIIDFEYY